MSDDEVKMMLELVERQATYQHWQVSYHKQAAGECALRWIWFIFNRLSSHAETGTGEAVAAGRHRAQ